MMSIAGDGRKYQTRNQGEASRSVLLPDLERIINRRKDLNRIVLDVTIRGIKILIPYLAEDAEAT